MARRGHPDSVAFRHRNAFRLLTAANYKTPKGEEAGYLTAILYLLPHTSGGGRASLCPFSTAECRAMCLSSSGRSALPRSMGAKQRRTDLLNNDLPAFLDVLKVDIDRLSAISAAEGLSPAVRLNGTSDVVWERLIDMGNFPVQFYDYTKIPVACRTRRPDYRLTYSVGSLADMARAVEYLRAGQSVAVVVPEDLKNNLIGCKVDLGPVAAPFVDGDEHDLRFLDDPGSIVLLKPKGHLRSDLIRPNIVRELVAAARSFAA